MMKAPLVAVTGATGFLGRHVLDTLAGKGWRLRLLIRGDVLPRLATRSVELVRGDLADEDALQRLVRGATAVVHLAGLIKAKRRADFLAVNRDGSARLAAAIAAAAPGARCVLISSLSAREPHLSDYAGSKQAGEAAAIAALGEKADWVVLRPGVIYGPGDREGLALRRLVSAPFIPVPRAPEPRISFVHARDVAAAIAGVCLAGPSNAVFEVADERSGGYGWREIMRRLCEMLRCEPRFVPVPDSMFLASGAMADAWSSITGRPSLFGRGKAREILHRDWGSSAERQLPSLVWVPGIPLQAGLQDMLGWWTSLGLVNAAAPA
ncbi:NAD-dependent epimerase/dehydratase family protein [Siccirubricoccus sp. KC 17139]|uniref:NAD-dependent epimerase/dehydratase family protein n=1 Tax=Siccirubricoccus soli TaxID=2899147 RepID=A0ABT1D343_9PROT|nr:NAD-dependent epimerase/dehydratase family protein [Siccirubricoccus soli]MCO6416027.1 NAD-dependent epimerase/dehydratase family protein [Siccirubricoccus soli]MCP2682159.1 NAD-dependent epimerase/dehydratase family protein [Siccirubricoccus soli]